MHRRMLRIIAVTCSRYNHMRGCEPLGFESHRNARSMMQPDDIQTVVATVGAQNQVANPEQATLSAHDTIHIASDLAQ